MIDVITEIGNKLDSLYPNVEIHQDNIEGGFEAPSFFVQKIKTGVNPLLSDGQLRKYSYQIVYFPSNDVKNAAEIEHVESCLLDNFTILDNFATIKNREFTHNDNTLNLTFDVNVFAYVVNDTEKLKNVKIEGGLKNGR